MKFTPDKIFYLAAVSSIVLYMLWTHGNVEYMTDDAAGMNAAIIEGKKEMINSDDDSDIGADQARIAIDQYNKKEHYTDKEDKVAARVAIDHYIRMNENKLANKPYDFLRIFKRLTTDEDYQNRAMVFVMRNDSKNLKKFVSNI